jgi:predicted nucleotidyltransferase
MDAHPVLVRVAAAMERHKLEAVLIGNAAAALQGAPVTTVDIDFFFRRTPANVRKLKAIADELEAVVLRPYYPASALWRIVRDLDGLQLDFMDAIHGVRSFEGVRRRATEANIGGARILVAALADIIKSKKAAARPQDLAVLPVLEKALEEATHNPRSQAPESPQGK